MKIKFTPEAEEDLENLDSSIQERVSKKMEWLSRNFYQIIPEGLGGKWKNFYKLRVGNWRIIYQFKPETETIEVYEINLRDKVYKTIT